MKKFLFILFVFTMSYVNSNAQDNKDTKDVPVISIDDFQDKADEFVGKNIYITGSVDHVCKHGGKRLQLVGSKEDARLKIEAGDKINKFQKEIEGDDIKVYGTVKEKRIDEAYLLNWEDEVKDHHKPTDEEYKNDMKKIENLRKQIKESKKGYLSYYSMDAINFEVIK